MPQEKGLRDPLRVALSALVFVLLVASFSGPGSRADPVGTDFFGSPCSVRSGSTPQPAGVLDGPSQSAPPDIRLLYVTVIDSVLNEPIPGFVIEVYDSAGILVDRLVTDRSGRAVSDLAPGSYRLRIVSNIFGIPFEVRSANVDLQDASVRVGVSYSAVILPARVTSLVLYAIAAAILGGVAYRILRPRSPRTRVVGSLATVALLVGGGFVLVPASGVPLTGGVPSGHLLVPNVESFVVDELVEGIASREIEPGNVTLHVTSLVPQDAPLPVDVDGALAALDVGIVRFSVEASVPINIVNPQVNALMLHLDTDPDKKLHDAVNKMFDEFTKGGMNMTKMKEVKQKTEFHTPKNECAFLPSDADAITYFPGLQFVDWTAVLVYDGNTHVVLGAGDGDALKNGTFFGGNGWTFLGSTITAFHEMLHVKIYWEKIDAGGEDKEHELIDEVWSAAQNKMCIAREPNAAVRDLCRTNLQNEINKIKNKPGGPAIISQLNLTAG